MNPLGDVCVGRPGVPTLTVGGHGSTAREDRRMLGYGLGACTQAVGDGVCCGV